MKYKKSMIIIFITIFLFSIAGACASDANATATATVNDHTDEINLIESNNPAPDDSQILSSSAGNEILKSGPTTVTNHTFEAIQSAYHLSRTWHIQWNKSNWHYR